MTFDRQYKLQRQMYHEPQLVYLQVFQQLKHKRQRENQLS